MNVKSLKHFINLLNKRKYSSLKLAPSLDESYLCNPANVNEISQNIANRKGVGNIQLVQELKQQLADLQPNTDAFKLKRNEFVNELLKIPNRTHPSIVSLLDEPRIINLINEPPDFNFKARQFSEISKRLHHARTEQLGNVSGSKSYTILGELAELEQALINYTLGILFKNEFKLISVSDLVSRELVRACGMFAVNGERTQIYNLDEKLQAGDLCLSATSEIALAGYFANKTYDLDKLPMKVAAVSRCYRAETSNLAEEKGIYRVHQFTKVEMFAISPPEHSDSTLEHIRQLEESMFADLGLHLRSLDMPPHELGAQAYRKYDIEAWMPGRNMFGEISSCSNCTDYQSRRLNIKYSQNGDDAYVHTLNGTACAIPRMLIALTETYQNDNGWVDIPEVLQPFMRGKTRIGKQRTIPELKLIKNKTK